MYRSAKEDHARVKLASKQNSVAQKRNKYQRAFTNAKIAQRNRGINRSKHR